MNRIWFLSSLPGPEYRNNDCPVLAQTADGAGHYMVCCRKIHQISNLFTVQGITEW